MTEISASSYRRKHVSMTSARIPLIVALMLITGQFAQAQSVIARYDFAGGSVTPAEASPDVVAGDYSPLLGAVSSSTSTHFINGDLLTEALAPIAEFTVTPNAGLTGLNLSSLDFGFRTDAAEVEDIFDLRLRSSLDGFTADLFSETRTNTTGTNDIPVSVDLTAGAFQGLTGPITFQWLASNNTTVVNERTRISPDVTLFGTIDGGGPDLSVTVDRSNGEIILENVGGEPLDFIGYSLTAPSGGLNPVNWDSIADTFDVNGSSATQVSPDDWTELTDPAVDTDLSEFDFESAAGATLAAGQSISLGVGAWTSTPFDNLGFTYVEPGGAEVDETIVFLGDAPLEGDFDADGDIDADDWNVVRSNLGGDVTGLSRVERYLLGDLDNDSLVGGGDFVEFKGIFEAANGAGSFAALLAIPEPSSALLLGLIGCVGFACRKARRAGVSVVALLVAAGISTTASAQISENFDGLTLGPAPAQLPDWSFFDLGAVTNDADWQISDDATTGANFGSLHLSQVNNNIDFLSNGQPIGGAFAIRDGSTGSDVDIIEWDFTLGGHGDGSGEFLDSRLVFGFEDITSFFTVQLVAGNAGGTNAQVSISFSEIAEGDTEVSRTDTFDTFGFTSGFPQAPSVISGELIHDTTAGSVTVSYTDDQGGLLFSATTTNPVYTRDGDVGFAVNNDSVSFDNLVVRELPRLTLQVDPVDGDIQIVNDAGEPIDIDYYEIFDTSETGGNLDPIAWNSLEEQNLAGFPAGDGSGNGWEEGDLSNPSQLIEAFLTDSSIFDDGVELYLGEAVADGISSDIAWQYHVTGSGSSFINGKVEFVDITPFLIGDADGDGDVDGDDLIAVRSNFGIPNPLAGDADNDGDVDGNDLIAVQTNFGNTSGVSVAVPEPTGIGLALFGGLLLTIRRRFRSATAVACCATAVVMAPTVSQATVFDRLLGLGEEEGASIGPVSGDSFDATAPFIDVSPSGDPQYVSIAGRPGAAVDSSTLGIEFDGDGDFLSGLRFGFPQTSRGAIGTTVGTPFGTSLNYTNIANRGLQLWVNPNSASSGTRQSVIHDTNQFGVLISDGATPTWIFQSQGTEFDTGVPVVFDDWTHVTVHREFGQGTIFYLDGVGITRTGSFYDALDTANLVIGSNTDGDEVAFSGGTGEFFHGVLDQVELYTFGLSDEGPLGEAAEDHGPFVFSSDNGFARIPFAEGGLSGVNGDVNNDGLLDSSDVDAFIDGWLTTNSLPFEEGFGGNPSSPLVDINSILSGDLNFDGATDISDAFLLHQALIASGSTGLDFSLLVANVPEPSTSLLVIGFASLLAARRR